MSDERSEVTDPDATVVLTPNQDEQWSADGSDLDGTASDDAQASEPSRRPVAWRRPAIIASAVVALVALVAATIWWVTINAAESREKAIRDTAQQYLTALAEGHAQDALKLLAMEPANKDLLTDEALKASAAATPLTDIAVTKVTNDQGKATASVTYKLGPQEVATDLALTGDGRVSWKIEDGLSDLMVTNIKGLRINGVTLSQSTNPVFPGTYVATPSVEQVALDGATSVTIPDPGTPVATLGVTPKLSEAGVAQARAAGKAALDACVASTVSAPPNCPYRIDETGVEIAPGTLKYTLTNDPWSTFVPALDLATMTAKGTVHYEVTSTATATRDGLTGEMTAAINRDTPITVDLLANPPVVTWA